MTSVVPVPFYDALHLALKKAVIEGNISHVDILEHFQKCVPPGQDRIGPEAIQAGAKRLGIQGSVQDAKDLLGALKAHALSLEGINAIITKPGMQNASRATANPRAMPTPVADVSVFENVIDRVAKKLKVYSKAEILSL